MVNNLVVLVVVIVIVVVDVVVVFPIQSQQRLDMFKKYFIAQQDFRFKVYSN